MTELVPNEVIADMSMDDIKQLRKKLAVKMESIRKIKSLKMEVYIQAEYRDAVEKAKAWAFKKGLIARDTKWTFAKFAIINTTKMILEEMDKEKMAHQQAMLSQEQPNIPQANQNYNMYSQ